jgi:hypothetical protein
MKKLALLGLFVGVVVVAWRAWRHDAGDTKLVFDRFWLDHEPRNGKDQFHALVLMGEHPVGHFALQTPWSGAWEGFHYHMVPRHEDQLDLLRPDEKPQRVTVRARACSEGGFDFCLELEGSSRGAKRYYSRKGWEFKGGNSDAVLERIREGMTSK